MILYSNKKVYEFEYIDFLSVFKFSNAYFNLQRKIFCTIDL